MLTLYLTFYQVLSSNYQVLIANREILVQDSNVGESEIHLLPWPH